MLQKNNVYKSNIVLLGILFLTIHIPGKSTNRKLIPVEDFFRNPEKISFRISPEGTHISYLAPYKGK